MATNAHGDEALLAAPVLTNGLGAYTPGKRRFQGIPGVEALPDGRLAMTFYTGGEGEGPENYAALALYDPATESVADPVAVVDPPGTVRAFDPGLWMDPAGVLWWWWNQSSGWFDGRAGVWVCPVDFPTPASESEPGLEKRSKLDAAGPRRIADGIMMNKPLVLSDGSWLFPSAVWDLPRRDTRGVKDAPTPKTGAHLWRTDDGGQSFTVLPGPSLPERGFDEHMVLERGDGTLVMAVRTHYGIGRIISADGGTTWESPTAGHHVYRVGPGTRFHLRRLPSGRVLLIYHESRRVRSHLTAYLSEDDGETFPWALLLDDRESVSYPDAAISTDGRLWVVYDRERTAAMEILLASITEDDILSGHVTDSASFTKRVVTSPTIGRAGRP